MARRVNATLHFHHLGALKKKDLQLDKKIKYVLVIFISISVRVLKKPKNRLRCEVVELGQSCYASIPEILIDKQTVSLKKLRRSFGAEIKINGLESYPRFTE